MEKIDYKKKHKALYHATVKEIAFIDVPELNYLMIDGQGDPNTCPAYQQSVEALYSLSYTLKFMIKKSVAAPIDYAVMPLEGLWWAHDMESFAAANKNQWQWTAMILQPDPVTREKVAAAKAQVQQKKELTALSGIRFASYHEGRCAQILHIGPYAAEGPTIQRLHQSIMEKGYELAGKHHEIYLGDPRRTAPEKLKTIIRQPFN